MKWIALGLLLTSTVVIAISILSGVKFSDLAKLGYLTFALAAGVGASKLLVQILRFRVITLGLAGDPKPDVSGLALTRVASEFVSLSTPATSMGVFIRTSWLTGKGIDGGKALAIGYFEVLIEIYVGAGLALVAALYILTKGAGILGYTILAVATILIAGYTLIFTVPALKGVKVPHFFYSFTRFLIGGPRADDLYLRAVVGSLNFSLSVREIARRKYLPVVVKAVGLTIVEDFLVGTALWIILNASDLKIGLVSSTLAAYGVVAIAQIPVSIGGAGITELTMKSYLTIVYGFSTWAPVVLWRIATYQVLLAVTGIVFIFFVRKSTAVSSMGSKNTRPEIRVTDVPGLASSSLEKRFGRLETRYGVVKRIRFAIAGGVGFVVTEVILTVGLLVFFGRLSLPHASFASPALLGLDVLSLVIGVSASFVVNERITVHVPKAAKGEGTTRFKRLLKFQAVSGIGNIGIVVVQLVLLATLELSPLLGTIVGALVTYPPVYYISIRYVWKAHKPDRPPQ
jgi:putative flippase GtrA